MKFTALSADLERALVKANTVVPSRSPLAILETILFSLQGNTLTLTGTDSEISLVSSLVVNGKQDGKVAIPAKRLVDTVRAVDGDITFSIDDGSSKLMLSTSTGEFGLTTEPSSEFPDVPELTEVAKITVAPDILRRMIHQTTFAVSTDELRPAMMGVLFQVSDAELRMVSTDGHRLVRISTSMTGAKAFKQDIIVPAKALNAIQRSLDADQCSIAVGGGQVRFASGATTIFSRLIDESYPNYQAVIPQDNTKLLTANRDALARALRRVSLYANINTHQVRFSMGTSRLTISAQDLDFGGEARESIDCEYTGEPLEIGFNAQYVADMLAHIDTASVQFSFSTPTRAGIVKPVNGEDGEHVLMLVMPVRLTA